MKKQVIFMVLVFFFGCQKTQDPALEDLLQMEDTAYEGMEVSSERVEELKKDIEKYREIVNQKVHDNGQLGVYYKLLALAYMDEKMYGPALGALREAIKIFPDNSNLHYRAGLSAAHMGKAIMNQSEKQNYYSISEQHYLQALNLHHQFGEALYGISILYIFELDEPAKATPYVEKLMALEKNNVEAMFLRARLYVNSGEVDKAMEIYGHIAANSNNQEQVMQAKNNRRMLLEGWDQ